jgi:hypothetical protein
MMAQDDNPLHKGGAKPPEKKIRSLGKPDFIYKGVVHADGVTAQGTYVLPKQNEYAVNASNLFNQCLFRVEIKQKCEVNKRHLVLAAKKLAIEKSLRK